MTSKTYEFELLINDSHLDSLGHVNNAKYLEMLEQARWDVLVQNGLSFEKILAEKTVPVVLEVNIKFKKELRKGDRVNLLTNFLPRNGKIITVEQQIVTESGQISALATFTMAIFDLNSRKIIEPTSSWLKLLE